MSENIDITKYFGEVSGHSTDGFFDQVKTIPETDGASQEFKTDSTNKNSALDTKNEPVVCKLFQMDHKPSSNNSSNFFDAISETTNTHSPQFNISSKLLTAEDIFDSFQHYEENVQEAELISEDDRCRDAWIPSEQTRKILIEMVTSPPGLYIPKKESLTMPGVILEEDMKDPIQEAVHHYLGPAEAAMRKVLTASEVTQDDRGLKDLIQAGCYRAAVNLTKTLLTIYGQGAGRAGHPSKHTVHSIQLWFTRLSLLVKLRSFTLAQVEAEPFGDLAKPDMFFQFYPELYGGRIGSMVPFSLRLLIAQLPAYVEKHQLALTKLFHLLSIIRKMLSNLQKGLLEDGTPCELSQKIKEDSYKFWSFRESRVLHFVVNTALLYKDYNLAVEVMQSLISKENEPSKLRPLQSALGRLLLQIGDINSAEALFTSARLGLDSPGLRDIIDSGLLLISQSRYEEAYQMFEQVYRTWPKSITAINNMAVCLLYTGRLKDSVLLLEEALQKYPNLAIHESLLLNLCTLYELQSSVCSQPKMKLLSLLSQFKGDGMNVQCLKLQI